MQDPNYARGFEDALELALTALDEAKSLEEAKERVRYYMSLIKERKFEKIRYMLGALR